MKKIDVIITDITGKGGIEQTTGLICRLFNNNGYKTEIVSLFKNYNAPYIEIPPETSIKFITEKKYLLPMSIFRRIWLIFTCIKQLRRQQKNMREDIIICQAFLPALIIFFAGLSSSSIVCEHFTYNLYHSIGIKLRNYIYSKFKGIITLTENDKKKYLSVGLCAYTIPNMSTFPIKQNKGKNSKKIISIGRLHRQKGFDILLHALVKVFDKYPDWTLEIYGEGVEAANLMNLSNKLGIENNVRFNGFTNLIADKLINSAFYVMSSRYEGFPMALLEAMACGCPIVSFNCPEGPSDLLENDGGLLVSHLNCEELSNAIIYMIEHPESRMDYAQQAYRNVEKYTPKVIYQKWASVFSNLYE